MKADSSEQAFQGVLLADIGGTNARFAILADGMVREIARMAVSDYRSFTAVLNVPARPSGGMTTSREVIAAGPHSYRHGQMRNPVSLTRFGRIHYLLTNEDL